MPPLLVPVTNDMRIALADDIIDRTARLATLSPDAQPELHAMAKASLDARMQRYTVNSPVDGCCSSCYSVSCSVSVWSSFPAWISSSPGCWSLQDHDYGCSF